MKQPAIETHRMQDVQQEVHYVAVLDDYQRMAPNLADWASLGTAARTVFFHDHVEDVDQLAERLRPFTVIVAMRERTRFGADLIGRLPNLKLLVSLGMWNAAIDLAAAKAHGVTVCGTDAGSDPYATPNLTWALILGLTRGLYAEAACLRAGGWQHGLGTDVGGKTLGLLGLGTIGQRVAKIGAACGMKPIAWSQNLTHETAAAHGVTLVGKEELFSRSDVLSIHLKLGDRTRNLVDAEALSRMKPTAFLVNTSRGPIVSEPALVAALRDKRIAGAALDVFDAEPLPPDHPFRYLPNVLATPHLGGAHIDKHREIFPQVVEDIAAWLAGTPIRLFE